MLFITKNIPGVSMVGVNDANTHPFCMRTHKQYDGWKMEDLQEGFKETNGTQVFPILNKC